MVAATVSQVALCLMASVHTQQLSALRDELDVEGARWQMPTRIQEAIKAKMPQGTHISVGFEFECTSKSFSLRAPLPADWSECPGVAFPLDGVSNPEPEDMLPELFRIHAPAKELSMSMFNMPMAVRNVVWTYDGLDDRLGPECNMSYEPYRNPNNDSVYNNGKCFCEYSLEYKTLPVHTADDIRESMIGAALTIKEASKKANGFVNWNVQKLFKMEESRAKCNGATHVTKAFVINKVSLIDMLKQQMFGYCAKSWPKEMSGDKVFRTSFAEAYMLWRAMSYCNGEKDCEQRLTLSEMCLKVWPDTGAAQADIDVNLFGGQAEKASILEDIFHAMGGENKTDQRFSEWSKGGVCSPAWAVWEMCEVGGQMANEASTSLDHIVASDPDLGFGGEEAGWYYGPGGGRGDTTTKVGAMLSADGRIVYGLAEYRKDPWNTISFRQCLYGSLRNVRSFEDGSGAELVMRCWLLRGQRMHSRRKSVYEL
mmetsp:Transcript_39987/g.79090  ORF Transcript_39987/g.79090 Transcript_39987/m.79090 type:complete len:483 (+) Transcript_39987:103-1551(+)